MRCSLREEGWRSQTTRTRPTLAPSPPSGGASSPGSPSEASLPAPVSSCGSLIPFFVSYLLQRSPSYIFFLPLLYSFSNHQQLSSVAIPLLLHLHPAAPRSASRYASSLRCKTPLPFLFIRHSFFVSHPLLHFFVFLACIVSFATSSLLSNDTPQPNRRTNSPNHKSLHHAA